jgi:hypothetical protein
VKAKEIIPLNNDVYFNLKLDSSFNLNNNCAVNLVKFGSRTLTPTNPFQMVKCSGQWAIAKATNVKGLSNAGSKVDWQVDEEVKMVYKLTGVTSVNTYYRFEVTIGHDDVVVDSLVDSFDRTDNVRKEGTDYVMDLLF